MKLLRIWVPDPNAPGFAEEVRRQTALLRDAPEQEERLISSRLQRGRHGLNERATSSRSPCPPSSLASPIAEEPKRSTNPPIDPRHTAPYGPQLLRPGPGTPLSAFEHDRASHHRACPRRGCAERGRVAVRGGAQARLPARAHRQERGAVRDRLRAFGTAAYRHLRRGRAHLDGAPRLPRAHRRQDHDPPYRLLGRHGRPAEGAGQRPEPRPHRAPPRQAAVRGARTRSGRMRASARTTMRGCAPSSTPSASITSSCRRPSATVPAVSTRRCSPCSSATTP